MPQVEYINNGDDRRTVKIINDDGSVERYYLDTDFPAHVQIIIDLDAQAQLRLQIEQLYVDPDGTV